MRDLDACVLGQEDQWQVCSSSMEQNNNEKNEDAKLLEFLGFFLKTPSSYVERVMAAWPFWGGRVVVVRLLFRRSTELQDRESLEHPFVAYSET